MHENTTRLRIELDVAAMQVTQYLQLHHEQVEQEVQKGVQMAIEHLTQSGTLAEMVKEQVVSQVIAGIRNEVGSYSAMKEIREKIQAGIQQQVTVFAEKIIDDVVTKLK